MPRIESFNRDGEGFRLVYRNDEYTLDALLSRLAASGARIGRVRVRSEESRLRGVFSFGEFLAAKEEILAAAMEPRDTLVRIEAEAGGAPLSLAFDPLDMTELLFTTADKEARLPLLLGEAPQP